MTATLETTTAHGAAASAWSEREVEPSEQQFGLPGRRSSEGTLLVPTPQQRTHGGGSELSRAGSFAGGYHGFRGALGARCSQRQGDGERGAFADAVAGCGDASVVGLDQSLDDG